MKKWYKDIGSHVQKGEILAEIDTPEMDQQLAQARADLVTSQANLSLATLTATRYQDLIKTDSVSQQDVDNANGDLAAKPCHGAIGGGQRQATGRTGIVQARLCAVFGSHHAAGTSILER